MKTRDSGKSTTVFRSGTSLAVRLPKGFTLPIGRVKIMKNASGNIELAASKNDWPENWETMFETVEWEAPERIPALPALRGLTGSSC